MNLPETNIQILLTFLPDPIKMATDDYNTYSTNYKRPLPPAALQTAERDQAKSFAGEC